MIRSATRAVFLVFVAAQGWGLGVVHGDQTRDRGGASTAGAAVIAGVVVGDDDARQPVRRAIVTLSGGELKLGRSVITDAEGRFAFAALPPGRYTLKAAKAGYLTTTLGARSGSAGTALVLADGTSIADVTVRLPRGAVITGTVTSPKGEPLSGLSVSAVSVQDPESQPFSITEPGVTTDDRGVYRIFGLPAGDYYVVATPPMASGLSGPAAVRSGAEIDAIFRRLRDAAHANAPATATQPSTRAGDLPPPDRPGAYGYAPIFYPGTPSAADAAVVPVTTGQERGGIDIVVDRVRMAVIEGSVTGPAGALPPVSLSIQPHGVRPRGFHGGSAILSIPIDGQGRFRYTGVAPGQYTVFVRTTTAPAPAGGRAGGGVVQPPRNTTPSRLWAAADVTVLGDDVVVSLELQPALSVTGRVHFQGTSAPPGEPAPARVQITRDGPTGMAVMNGTAFGAPGVPAAPVAPDGTFQIAGALPGTYRLSATVPGSTDWWLRSAMLEGRDVLDEPLTIATRSVENVVLTFLDRQSELYGELRLPTGAPAFDTSIVVFPVEPSLWRRGARRIRTAAAASDGQFAIRGLPGGEYFLAVLPAAGAHRLYERAFLDQLSRASIKLAIADGERKRQDLRFE